MNTELILLKNPANIIKGTPIAPPMINASAELFANPPAKYPKPAPQTCTSSEIPKKIKYFEGFELLNGIAKY